MIESERLWLERLIELCHKREDCAGKINEYRDENKVLIEQLPMNLLESGSVREVRKELVVVRNALESLSSISLLVDENWRVIWCSQKEKVIQWCEQIENEKESLLFRERLLCEMKDAESQLEEHWSSCPNNIFRKVSREDGIECFKKIKEELSRDRLEQKIQVDQRSPTQLTDRLRIRARMRYLGIVLETPEIVDETMFHQEQENLAFQVEWLSKLPAMLIECTPEEVETLDVPTVPFTKSEILMFLDQFRMRTSQKKSWKRVVQKKYKLNESLYQMHRRAQRVSEGQPFIEMILVGDEPLKKKYKNSENDTLFPPFWFSFGLVTEALYHFGSRSKKALLHDPVTSISWFQALNFCNQMSERDGLEPCYSLGIGPAHVVWNRKANGYRLPTEEEWELAAQAHFEIRSRCSLPFVLDSENTVQRMTYGQRKTSILGLPDRNGNVWEWCFDAFVQRETPCSVDERRRVVCGGPWKNPQTKSDSGRKDSRFVEKGYGDVGFRLVRNG